MVNPRKLYTKCLRCNKPLKSVEAQKRGYGPTCWHNIKQEHEKHNGLFELNTKEERK